MGYGQAHKAHLIARRHRIAESLLRLYLGLQSRHGLHQILDPATVPAYLSPAFVPGVMPYHDRYSGHLYLLDFLQRRLRLCVYP